MSALFSSGSEYPKSVYEDAWEDMELLCENWIALHGVDRIFCKLTMNSNSGVDSASCTLRESFLNCHYDNQHRNRNDFQPFPTTSADMKSMEKIHQLFVPNPLN